MFLNTLQAMITMTNDLQDSKHPLVFAKNIFITVLNIPLFNDSLLPTSLPKCVCVCVCVCVCIGGGWYGRRVLQREGSTCPCDGETLWY